MPRVGLLTYAPPPQGAAAPGVQETRRQVLNRAIRAVAAGPGAFLCEIEGSLLTFDPAELRTLVVPGALTPGALTPDGHAVIAEIALRTIERVLGWAPAAAG